MGSDGGKTKEALIPEVARFRRRIRVSNAQKRKRIRAEQHLKPVAEQISKMTDPVYRMLWMSGPDDLSVYLHTGTREAAEALYESESRYRTLVESMNDGLVTRDANGLITYVNGSVTRMLGYAREELVGRPANDFFDEANREIVREQIFGRMKGQHDPYELTWTRKDGSKLHTIMSPWPLFDRNARFIGSFAVMTDITRLKRVEEELRQSEKRLRLLSSHLIIAQEEERERISRELHDEVGQDLAVLKFQVRSISGKLRKDQAGLKQACEDALAHLDQLVELIRYLSRDLSPPVLKNLGLTASIKKMAEEFAKHGQVEVSSDIDPIDRMLSPEQELNLYRILREGLTNIGKHAEASHISISVKSSDSMIHCALQDDGTGFDPTNKRTNGSVSPGMGLLTMEERSRILGGYLDITSGEGKGTRISLMIPVRHQGGYDGSVPHSAGR
jgi:PAS domain S-box-containing protein